MRPDSLALLDIANEARLILAFVHGLDRDAFLLDVRTQRAVLRSLVIIGEAAKRLSPLFRSEHHEVAWAEIAGMRDVLVHAYHRVNLDQVWEAATRDVPQLLAYVEQIAPASED